MSTREKLLTEAIAHLGEAKRAMGVLASVTGDWSAKVRLGLEFEGVEDACREFAELQLGLGVQAGRSGRRRRNIRGA